MEQDELKTEQRRLVTLIQSGQEQLYPELWETVSRFVYSRASRYYAAFKETDPLIELDELINAGYIAMIAAAKGFKPDGGKTFASWLMFFLRSEWRNLYGFDAKDAIYSALSLDAPVGDSEGDLTLGDSISDVTSLTPEEATEQADSRLWLKGAVDELLTKLPNDTESIIRASYLLRKDNDVLSRETGLDKRTIYRLKNKGLNQLRAMTRRTPLGQKIREYYKGSVRVRRVGINEFSHTHTSEQENYLIKLEQAERQALKQMPLDDLEPEEIVALSGYRNKHYSDLYFYNLRHKKMHPA